MIFRRKKEHDARQHYRRAPGKTHQLGVLLELADRRPLSGTLADVSAGGAAILFPKKSDPGPAVGQDVQLCFVSLGHGSEVRVPARVVSARTDDQNRRYGFQFTDVEALFQGLDAYYFKFFNRRRTLRVRPDLGRRLEATVRALEFEGRMQVHDLSLKGLALLAEPAAAESVMAATTLAVEVALPKAPAPIGGPIVPRHATTHGKQVRVGFEVLELTGGNKAGKVLESYLEARRADIARWESL